MNAPKSNRLSSVLLLLAVLTMQQAGIAKDLKLDHSTRTQINQMLKDISQAGGMVFESQSHPYHAPAKNDELIEFGSQLVYYKSPSRVIETRWTKHFTALKENEGDLLMRVSAKDVDHAIFWYFGKNIVNHSTHGMKYENHFYYYGWDGNDTDDHGQWQVQRLSTVGSDLYKASGVHIETPTNRDNDKKWQATMKRITSNGKDHLILLSYWES